MADRIPEAERADVLSAPVVPRPRRDTGGALTPAARRPTRGAHIVHGRPKPMWRTVVTYAALVAVVAGPAVFLRIWGIGQLGLNSDEAVYAGQAASLAGDPGYVPYFPVFRAHPLLFQTLLSIPYHYGGVSPLLGRLLAAGFGLGTVWLVYATGMRLYGRRAGIYAALFIALMPYQVIVSRQILLDGPMAFFATLALYLIVRYGMSRRPVWLYAAGGALGLTILSKETGVLLLGGVYAFFALSRTVRVRVRDLTLSTLVLVLVVLPYPVSILASGRSTTGGKFLTWQLFRRPNHSWTFYPTTLPQALGIALLVLIAAGLWVLRRHLSWRELLLVCWIAGPALFFEAWSVKGYQYLLPVASPVALLGGRVAASLPLAGRCVRQRWYVPGSALRVALVGAVAVSLGVPSWLAVQQGASATSFLAGTGGVPGGREAGQWVDAHVPQGAKLLALGPSMANIVEFYGHRQTFGLSVSPNPLHRNPVYEPVHNPDLLMRRSDLQYVVWDSYSASRSPFFARKLLSYVERYHGQVAHEEFVTVAKADGQPLRKPVIVIYEVRP